MVHFGDDAGAVIETLTGILGTPDYDSGWLDPSLPASEPLWPGCPGATARLLSWDEPGLSIVLTDWAQNDLQNPGDARASTGSPYFAGYGVAAAEPPQLRTPEGAYPGLTLPELQELFGERLFVSPEPDEAVGLYWFAIDGTGSPLTRMGGIRGWLFEPDINSPDYQPGLEPGEAFEIQGLYRWPVVQHSLAVRSWSGDHQGHKERYSVLSISSFCAFAPCVGSSNDCRPKAGCTA